MKKVVCLALALTLALSLFAGISLAEDRRVLSFASTIAFEDYFDNDVIRRIEDELNIDVQFTRYDEDSFAAMLSGGDLADIILPKNMLSNILASGLALNVDPYIDEYAPNLKGERCTQTMDLSRQLLSTDGGLYIIPPVIGLHNAVPGGLDIANRGYVVRWDWYKEIGCPEIKNDDDYLSVLQQMIANHPTTENGDKTILFGVDKSFTNLGGYRGAFSTSANVNHWANYQFKNNIFTNEVEDGYTDPENSRYWTDMKFYNKMYRMGLWDEDNFTHSSDEYNAKVDKGQYCGIYYCSSNLYNAARKTDPDTISGYITIPSEGMNNYCNIQMLMGNAPSYYFFIWKDSKNIDIAMQFVNYMYDLDFLRWIYSGDQGETWDYDENGVARLTEQAMADRAAGTDYWTTGKGGHGMRSYSIMGYNPAVLGNDGYPLDLKVSREAAVKSQTGIQKDYAEYYGFEYWGDAWTSKGRDFRNDMGEAISACVAGFLGDGDLRTLAACDGILEENMANLIMAESDEEFAEVQEAVIEEIQASGEPDVFARYQVEWNRVRDLLTPVHAAASEQSNMELYPVD